MFFISNLVLSKNTMVKFLKKYHKWIGIISIFFILNFAFSGVLLNHRQTISGIDVSRSWLPSSYHFQNWNNGAAKGTLKLSADSILLYGASGVWLTDSLCNHLEPYHKGMPKGIDNRNLRAIIKVDGKGIWGISTHKLYRLDRKLDCWENVTNSINPEAAFTDLCAKADTLFVVTRSHVFKTSPPYENFQKIELKAASDYKPSVSLFKTMWILHSGEIFGLPGKLIVDILGIIIVIITLTGLALTLIRIPIRRRLKAKQNAERLKDGWKFSLKWHNKLGYGLFVLLLFVVITGTFLRPPLLITIVKSKVAPIPYSTLDSENAWNEKLRTLRYNADSDKWILYSSDGFYEFNNFQAAPTPIRKKPPVSVMGVTVMEQVSAEEWLIGSFSGLYKWNAESGISHNAFTGELYKPKRTFGPPVMTNPINGYSKDFAIGGVAFDYAKGAVCLDANRQFPEMPFSAASAPMSLWHFALELHVGRMYGFFLGPLSGFFVFFSGLLFLFILISGYLVYKRRHKKRKKPLKK